MKGKGTEGGGDRGEQKDVKKEAQWACSVQHESTNNATITITKHETSPTSNKSKRKKKRKRPHTPLCVEFALFLEANAGEKRRVLAQFFDGALALLFVLVLQARCDSEGARRCRKGDGEV